MKNGAKLYGNPFNSCPDILLKTKKCQHCDGAGGKVVGSPKSLGFNL